MTRAATDQLLYLMDQAFDAPDHEHSLLANLRSVTEDDWLWTPPGGRRTIAAIVGHVAACKYMYDNHAFGDAQLAWTDPQFYQSRPLAGAVEWSREGQRRLREHVAQLRDDDLLTLRRANWGEMKETRWLISVMIEHDLYHAGEINHIRALRQGNDAWARETAPDPARPEVLEG